MDEGQTLKPGQPLVYKTKDENGAIELTITPNPTWLRLPKELGGNKVDVVEIIRTKVCPCGAHAARVFILKCDYMVVECPTKGWTWMQKPKDVAEFKKRMTS